MARRHTDDSKGTGTTATRRSILKLGGLATGAIVGGGAATAMAQTEPTGSIDCESGTDTLSFGAGSYGAQGYGGVA